MSNGAPRPKPGRASRTITLKYPILVENEEISELTIPERLRAGDLLAFDTGKGDMDGILRLLESLTNVPYSSLKNLDAEDLMQLGDLFEGKLDPFLSRKTGGS